MSKTEKRVKQIVYEQLGRYAYGITTPDDIKKSHGLEDDLNAYSLEVVELIMALEEEFDTEILDETAEKWKTVGDVIGHFEK